MFVVRVLVCAVLLICFGSQALAASHQRPPQDPSGTTWALQAMAALTGGTVVSSVSESGSVTRTVGNDQQTGNITLQSSGNTQSQLEVSTGAGDWSENRSWASDGSGPIGEWTGLNGVQHQMQQINCWTDAVWFFPALSLLSDTSDPTMVFVDLGQQQFNGDTVEHIQAYRYLSNLPTQVQQQLQQASTVDYYLDSGTFLPVAMGFTQFGDADVTATVPIVVIFSQYQAINGVEVPLQVARSLNGSPYLQITISSASVNGQGSPDRR